jgi:N,N'-diacetyllegionaminate synthase
MNLRSLKKCFIIAEIGNNHEGSFNIACKLIKKAKDVGVDAVKFQTYETKNFINKFDTDRFDRLEKFKLTKEEFYKLSVLTKKYNLKFISTPFDISSAIFLSKIVDLFKISSGDNNYFQLIEKILKFNMNTVISTGLLDYRGIANLYKFIKEKKFDLTKLGLLHCVSSYPTPDNEANLLSINFLRKKFSATIGYSDHTIGEKACLVATALGARIIEKHFTLDNNYSGFRDHKISLNPINMRYLVDSIRSIENMLGQEKKIIQKSEKKNISSMRRSIYSSRFIPKNSKINLKDILITRPFSSLEPSEIKKVIGKINKKNILGNKPLYLKDFKSSW